MSSIYSGINSDFIARIDDSHLWNTSESYGEQRKHFLYDFSTQWMIWRHPLCARNCVEQKGEQVAFFWVSNCVFFFSPFKLYLVNSTWSVCVCVVLKATVKFRDTC